MRIDNSYLSGLTAGETRGSQGPGEAGQKGEARADRAATSSSHVPSPELARLRALLQASPASRSDVLDRVGQRLKSGYYLTQDAAQQTADALLNAAE